MFVLNISSYFNITCIVSHILTIKQVVDKYFSKALIATHPIFSKEYYHKCRNVSTPNLRRFIHFPIFKSIVKRNYFRAL